MADAPHPALVEAIRQECRRIYCSSLCTYPKCSCSLSNRHVLVAFDAGRVLLSPDREIDTQGPTYADWEWHAWFPDELGIDHQPVGYGLTKAEAIDDLRRKAAMSQRTRS